MSSLRQAMKKTTMRLDDPILTRELVCQDERANWVAKRVGLPGVGSTLQNQYGIEWVVQSHVAAPREESLQRWRTGDVQPHMDLYPVIVPKNFSPQLMEFFYAIDRCTTKSFAIIDTMPGSRRDGHVPGGNFIDTICNPMTNLLYLDAARVHETVVAHELGHAWVQYVDECEDYRTMEDASNPQRMRLVSHVQSYVLDLKVNDLLRKKGFDMSPIETDQAITVRQLAEAFLTGYSPEHLREEVFMALLVADQILDHDRGRNHELAQFDHSLVVIRDKRLPLANLAERLADAVRRHGYDSRDGVLASVDECLLACFEHCGDRLDLDNELVEVNPPEPNLDKFPDWLSPLSPKTKTVVGKHMARNDISSEWSQRLETAITGRARLYFTSPERDNASQIRLQEMIGPSNRYTDLPDDIADMLAMKHLNETKGYKMNGGPPHQTSDLHKRRHVPDFPRPALRSPLIRDSTISSYGSPTEAAPHPNTEPGGQRGKYDLQPPHLTHRSIRPYMAGTGRFLTAARLQEQLMGEHPFAYAENNPTTYVDPSGRFPVVPIENPYEDALCQVNLRRRGSPKPKQPCDRCAEAILEKWWSEPAHNGNHAYAHCMACCTLTRLAGPDCASDKQVLQNLIDVWPFKDRVKRIGARFDFCNSGIEIGKKPVKPPASSHGDCHTQCLKEHPTKGKPVPSFTFLKECDKAQYGWPWV